jgi:nucleoside-diphosphate-sugar epimerase
MRVTVIGANGFVGSAFVRFLQTRPDVELVQVTRGNFDLLPVVRSDIVIEAACNSKKYLADQNPLAEFEASVTHRLKSLQRYPAGLQLHISSVDVYGDLSSPAVTREETPMDLARVSTYGLHKLLAEQLVQHYDRHWLIIRLAGMVGPGLRKNPVYDILNGLPLRVHPDSRYQYMLTDDVARISWALVERNISNEIFNLCGDGVVTMREIAGLAGRSLDCSSLPAGIQPRIVEANNEKIRRWLPIPRTTEVIQQFVKSYAPAVSAGHSDSKGMI